MCCKCWKNGERRRGKIPDLLATVWPGTEEGPAEDFANQEAIAKLLRFVLPIPILLRRPCLWKTTFPAERRAGENLLYHRRQLRGSEDSPHLELLRKKGIEVLLLSDPSMSG